MTQQSEVQAPAQIEPEIAISSDPYLEYVTILKAKTAVGFALWDLGDRLRCSRASGQFLQLEIDGRRPKSWDHFMSAEFVDLSEWMASRAMALSSFTRKQAARYGVERLLVLHDILTETSLAETPEQAVALELPLADGGKKPFGDMTIEEVKQAHQLLKHQARPAGSPEKQAEDAARQLEKAAQLMEALTRQFDAAGKPVEGGTPPASREERPAAQPGSHGGPSTPRGAKLEGSPELKALWQRTTDLLGPFVSQGDVAVYLKNGEPLLDLHEMKFKELGAIAELLKQLTL